GDLEARVAGVAADRERLVGRAKVSSPEIGNRRYADVVRDRARWVGAEQVDNREQVGVIGPQAVDRAWKTGEKLLRAAVVAGTGVCQRPNQREPMRDPSL